MKTNENNFNKLLWFISSSHSLEAAILISRLGRRRSPSYDTPLAERIYADNQRVSLPFGGQRVRISRFDIMVQIF